MRDDGDNILMWRGLVSDARAMRDLGGRIARALLEQPLEETRIVRLEGNLGAGKTTLVRGLLHALGYEGPVRSPTYTLIEPYEVPVGEGSLRVTHMDLYRLADPEELEFLGLRDLIYEPGWILVEWPDRGGDLLPRGDLRICIDYQGTGRFAHVSTESGLLVGKR